MRKYDDKIFIVVKYRNIIIHFLFFLFSFTPSLSFKASPSPDPTTPPATTPPPAPTAPKPANPKTPKIPPNQAPNLVFLSDYFDA